jgi:hypothetical protein
MRIPSWHKIAALVAAYAIALQALLAVFVVAAPLGIAAASAICQQDADRQSPAQSPDHTSCAACLAGHCAAAPGGVAAEAMPIQWPAATAHIALASRDAMASPLERRDRHFARAPPRA